MGATCSAVLSAACHQPLPDDAEAYKFPLQWGAVSHPMLCVSTSHPSKESALLESDWPDLAESDLAGRELSGFGKGQDPEHLQLLTMSGITNVQPGHCCFTTARDVEAPRIGQMYA
jgi:hypothetical protein